MHQGFSITEKPERYPLSWPLAHAEYRATPLGFGIEVTEEYTPLKIPERFRGFHTATDFEIFSDEQEDVVDVFAACDGMVVVSGFTGGYGGLIVQRCAVRGEDVTVLYGHLDQYALARKGAYYKRGQKIAQLAPAYSKWSGRTRKHLHFAVHRGSDVEYLGYVDSEEELNQFVNPTRLLPQPYCVFCRLAQMLAMTTLPVIEMSIE